MMVSRAQLDTHHAWCVCVYTRVEAVLVSSLYYFQIPKSQVLDQISDPSLHITSSTTKIVPKLVL